LQLRASGLDCTTSVYGKIQLTTLSAILLTWGKTSLAMQFGRLLRIVFLFKLLHTTITWYKTSLGYCVHMVHQCSIVSCWPLPLLLVLAALMERWCLPMCWSTPTLAMSPHSQCRAHRAAIASMLSSLD
jgi:hypothetical protein